MRPRTQRRIVILVPPLLVALLAVPFLLHQNSWWEWANAYWLLQRQAEHVSAHGTPTYFLHTNAGAFYPHYVFYAGFTFSVLAYPAAVLGAWPVFAAATVAALVAGYLGIWWSARNLGLSARLAVLPALTFATTPYVVSELYGRGAWAELIAVSAVAVMLGGLTALLWHPERGRGGPIAALAGSGAVVAGTHNLTVLMSAIALPLILAALLPLAPRSGGVRGLARRIGLATGAIALGVALTGAWLVPDLWLGPHTSIAEPAVNTRLLWANRPDVWIGNVLSPWPRVPPVFRGISWIHAQPPVLAMVWALVALAALGWAHRHRPDRVTAAAAGLVALGAGLLLVIVDPRWWLSFPDFLQAIQFPYRLITYLAIVIAMAITVALNILRGRRVMVGALVLAVGAQAAMAGFIAVGSKASGKFSAPPQRQEDVRVDEEPPSFSHPRLYTQFQFRTLGHPTGGREPTKRVPVSIESPTRSDVGGLQAFGAAGERVTTGVVWSPLVRIEGDVRAAGRDANGIAIVRVTHTDAIGHWSATVRPRCTLCLDALTGRDPWQPLAGQLLTLVSAMALTGLAVVGLLRRRRRGRRRPAFASDADLPADDLSLEDELPQRRHVPAT